MGSERSEKVSLESRGGVSAAYARERRAAVEAVVQACRLCRQVRSAMVTADTLAKKDRSPVTVADFGAQAVVNHLLAAAFPHDPIVGEEDAAALRTEANSGLRGRVLEHVQAVLPGVGEPDVLAAIDRGGAVGGRDGRFWTLDPIDGTKGFLRGEQYAVALALIEEGHVVLGVLGCPNLPKKGDESNYEGSGTPPLRPQSATPESQPIIGLIPFSPTGCLFIGVRGQGAAMRGFDGPDETPIHVNDVGDVARASFCESVESGHTSHGDAERIAERLGVTAPPVRIDSQCKYAAVARGDASIYLRLPTKADYEEKIWDHAAGWAVVTEAGGRVTDTRGEPLDFSLGRTLRNNVGVIATNGRLHDRVVEAVGEILSARRRG